MYLTNSGISHIRLKNNLLLTGIPIKGYECLIFLFFLRKLKVAQRERRKIK